MSSAPKSQVFRRRVFYIPGYDPVGARKYREIYRREGAAQAGISGYALALEPLPAGSDPYGWIVRSRAGMADVETRYEVLVWSDIVRNSMTRSVAASYAEVLHVLWTYLGSGAFWRLMQLRKGPLIAALYPVALLTAYLAMALGAAGLSAHAVTALFGAAPVIAWGVGLGVGILVLHLCRAIDGRIYAFYLMHLFSYCARDGGAMPPDLSARLERFENQIAEALDGDCDEVLVVGHSLGAHLAVTVLANVIRDGRVRHDGPALGLLTLGQVIPMVSFLPQAGRLRGDLGFLSQRKDLTWLDVSAPGDGCAFALCDPVAVSGVASKGQIWPLVISAAFTQTLSPSRQAELKRRYHRLHFQYLCAFDRPGDYDYFSITAGAMTLGQRFSRRAPSQSRIVRPMSKFTSVAQ